MSNISYASYLKSQIRSPLLKFYAGLDGLVPKLLVCMPLTLNDYEPNPQFLGQMQNHDVHNIALSLPQSPGVRAGL